MNQADVDIVDEVDVVDVVDNIRIPRQIFIRRDLFHSYDNREFFCRYRITKETALGVLEHIEPRLEYITQDKNNSISPINQLLLTLRVYATGCHLLTIGDIINADKSTISRIVAKVTNALGRLAQQYIYMPRNDNELTAIKNNFYDIAGFPKVIGAIDGTHVRILSPGGEDAEVFRNRKGYFSMNVQAVSDGNLLFRDIVARWPGSSHDSTIFNASQLKFRFEQQEFNDSILLGDAGYMNRSYLLTPFLETNTHGKQNFNHSHTRTRVKVENLFGVWKRRFPIMAYGCRLKLETLMEVIVATAVMHNIARLNGEQEPPIEDEVMEHELQELIRNGDIPNIVHDDGDHNTRMDLVNNYFNRM